MKVEISLKVVDNEGKEVAARTFEGEAQADVLSVVPWQQVFAAMQQKVMEQVNPNITTGPISNAAKASLANADLKD